MKIIHITDSHGTMKGPEGRIDVYYHTFLKKLYEIGYVVKYEKADMVIHTGDLFHSARVSDKLAGLTAEIMRSWGVPIYVVPGNHDIEGYSMDTIEHTKLGLLAKAGVVNLLERINPLTVDCGDFTVAISGQEYYLDIDKGNPDDFMMQQPEADINILCYHGLLTDHPMPAEMRHTLASTINTDADIILSGHLHTEFQTSVGDTDIYNPGSMMRIERSEHNKKTMPKYGVLDISLGKDGYVEYSYKMKQFRCAQPGILVFDFTTKQLVEQREITLENFRNSLQATVSNTGSTGAFTDVLKQMGTTNPEALKESEKLYADAIASAPDKFEFKQGYVAANKMKYITKVEIKNFQSHHDTTIEFDNGLNIIVGESNQGKTAILRAILWAVDNQPLGDDFITTGEDKCSVKITYSDGTSITRSRSKKAKSSGSYEADILDDNGAIKHCKFEGFTNAVPVEIDNVHQMPKVAITKDIETHLNLMSQLEGPFLITASPVNKAAAIGRLTGTHIADLAVSKASTEIRQIGVELKKSEDMRKQIEYELKQLPDEGLLDTATSSLFTLTVAANDLSADTEKIDNLIKSITHKSAEIYAANALIQRVKAVQGISNIINEMNSDIDMLEEISQRQDKIDEMTYNIEKFTRILEITKTMEKLFPIVNHVDDLARDITAIKNSIGRVIAAGKSVMHADLDIAYNKVAVDVLNFVVAKATLELNDLQKLYESKTYADNFVNRIDVVSNDIGENDADKQILTQQIQDTMNKMTEAVINVGVCPCCGQKIGVEHVDKVKGYILGGTTDD